MRAVVKYLKVRYQLGKLGTYEDASLFLDEQILNGKLTNQEKEYILGE